MKIECQLIYADGTSMSAKADVSATGDLMDRSSDIYDEAQQVAQELLEQFPESILVVFGTVEGSPEGGSAVLFPRPNCAAARELVSHLRDEAAKAGANLVSSRLDS